MKNQYIGMPQEARASLALEMATEIREQNNRLYSLAVSLRSRLEQELESTSGSVAFGLAELLEDLMGDCEQSYRLLDCLQAMQQTEQVAS